MTAAWGRPIPIKNTAYRLYFAAWLTDGTLNTGWTGAATQLNKDNAGFVDATNEATQTGTSGTGYIDIESGEMNYDCVVVKTTFTDTDAMPVITVLYPEEVGDINVDVTAYNGGAVPTPAATGVPDVNVTHINDSATAAANLAKSASCMVIGTAMTGGTQTTTSVQSQTAAILAINDDRIIGRNLIVATEAESFTACRITDFAVSGGVATITLDSNTPLYAALDPDDEFVIV